MCAKKALSCLYQVLPNCQLICEQKFIDMCGPTDNTGFRTMDTVFNNTACK